MIVTMWIRFREEGDRGVILIRIYGDRPVADVPAAVAGKPVIGVGEYCFSEKDLV